MTQLTQEQIHAIDFVKTTFTEALQRVKQLNRLIESQHKAILFEKDHGYKTNFSIAVLNSLIEEKAAIIKLFSK